MAHLHLHPRDKEWLADVWVLAHQLSESIEFQPFTELREKGQQPKCGMKNNSSKI